MKYCPNCHARVKGRAFRSGDIRLCPKCGLGLDRRYQPLSETLLLANKAYVNLTDQSAVGVPAQKKRLMVYNLAVLGALVCLLGVYLNVLRLVGFTVDSMFIGFLAGVTALGRLLPGVIQNFKVVRRNQPALIFGRNGIKLNIFKAVTLGWFHVERLYSDEEHMLNIELPQGLPLYWQYIGFWRRLGLRLHLLTAKRPSIKISFNYLNYEPAELLRLLLSAHNDFYLTKDCSAKTGALKIGRTQLGDKAETDAADQIEYKAKTKQYFSAAVKLLFNGFLPVSLLSLMAYYAFYNNGGEAFWLLNIFGAAAGLLTLALILMIIFYLKIFFSSQPVLTINPDGVTVNIHRRLSCRWSDIAAISLADKRLIRLELVKKAQAGRMSCALADFFDEFQLLAGRNIIINYEFVDCPLGPLELVNQLREKKALYTAASAKAD